MAVQVDEDECVACGTCVDECPNDALSLEDETLVIDEDACDECGTCVEACPTEALSLPE